MAVFFLTGLNYHTADLAIREKAAFEEASMPQALRQLAAVRNIREAIILSTCNRVEIITYIDHVSEGLQALESFWSDNRQIPHGLLAKSLYRYMENEAIRHVFRVASSLDSMVLGESQILGQVRSSYNLAVANETVGPYLNSMLQAAFRAAKRVRSETSIGEYSVSISSAAVDLAKKIYGDLRTKSILIIGAGKMGELAVRHMASSGAGRIRVTNRNPEAARQLAAQFQGTTIPFAEVSRWVSSSDIVITSTGAQKFLIDLPMIQTIMHQRKNAPIILIDIAVPRNVDPQVGTLENVFCYDIDDLGAVVAANREERRKESMQAERIIDQEVAAYCSRLKQMDFGPLVAQLQRRIQDICRLELDRYMRKSGPLTDEETRELESMVSRIANKIAHPLISQIRTGHQEPPHHEHFPAIIRRIFGLHQAEHDEFQNPIPGK